MVWEFQFITFLQQNGNAFFDFLWSVVSMFGEELIMVGVIGALYWCFNKEFAEYMGYSLLTSTVVNGLIKNVVTRDRPFQSDDWQIENKSPIRQAGILSRADIRKAAPRCFPHWQYGSKGAG